MQKLEKAELRKADRTVGVNCNILQLTSTVRSAFLSSVISMYSTKSCLISWPTRLYVRFPVLAK